MNSHLPAPAPRRNWVRRLVNLLVALVVIAVAAATFVFSYDGVHAIALLGGMSAQLARYYPALFDAVLVIACVTAVALREARWWARAWAWLVLVILLAAIGATDVLHAMNYTLRHRPTEGIVAAAPVVAVLLAFTLLLTLLRQSRTRSVAGTPALPGAAVRPPAPPAALPAGPNAGLAILAAEQDAGYALAPTGDDPVLNATAEPTRELAQAPQEMPPPPHLATQPNDVVPWAEPSWAEPPPAREPAAAMAPARPQGIRYADWDTEDGGQFAGLVYPAREESEHVVAEADGSDDDAGRVDGDDDSDEPGSAGSAPGRRPPELDDDAPPFATAPFASVPRLNRVRSTPAPPSEEDE